MTVARMKNWEAPVLSRKSKFPASSAKTYFLTVLHPRGTA